MADNADDLAATRTEGFKVGEKKTIDEYNQLGKKFACNSHSSLIDFGLTPFTPQTRTMKPCSAGRPHSA